MRKEIVYNNKGIIIEVALNYKTDRTPNGARTHKVEAYYSADANPQPICTSYIDAKTDLKENITMFIENVKQTIDNIKLVSADEQILFELGFIS